jgi:hypothetical protein
MKAVILFITLVLVFSSAQKIYSPGINVGIKDVLIFKIKDEVVPLILEEFKELKIPDQGVNQSSYELEIYDMEADIVPLTSDQITIITDETTNTLTVEIDNFQVSFDGMSYVRAYFLHSHGETAIMAKIRKIRFTVEPKLKADGDLNQLDYKIDDVTLDIRAGDIWFTKLSLGFLPNFITTWLLTPVTNAILSSVLFVFNELEVIFDTIIVKALDKWRVSIPDSIVVPGSEFSASLSFPNIPIFKADHVELPLDGTIFFTEQGYTPTSRNVSAMPSFNAADPNNVQLFVHQYVINTALKSLGESSSLFRIDSSVLEGYGLPADLLIVKWVSHLFPKLLCNFDKDAEIVIDLGIASDLVNDVEFSTTNVKGTVSPMFKFSVGEENEHAFTLNIPLVIDVDIAFGVAGKVTNVTGTVNTLEIGAIVFVAGTVPDAELVSIIPLFQDIAEAYAVSAVNGILGQGVMIPIIPVIQAAFEVDIDAVDLVLAKEHLAASFTVDISTLEKIMKKLLK